MHAFLRLTQTGGSPIFVSVGSIQSFYPTQSSYDTTRIDFVGDENDSAVVRESVDLIERMLEATTGVSVISVGVNGAIITVLGEERE